MITHFLNRLSNAARASLGERGGGTDAVEAGPLAGAGAASRATVTRGLNSVHSFIWSFTAIRTGIGLRHWNRVEGSK